ncbi:MAG TPA: hypothetical protein VMQ46_05725 [Acidimicrobiia bacterium]|nr:hypothetical protein [Acidimicrobiia bacterium]
MSRRNLWVAMLFLVWSFLVLASCSDIPDSQRATEIFADCLERNGVEVDDLEVTLNADGSVGDISATIVSEGDVPYEPTIRIACTQEVELDL